MFFESDELPEDISALLGLPPLHSKKQNQDPAPDQTVNNDTPTHQDPAPDPEPDEPRPEDDAADQPAEAAPTTENQKQDIDEETIEPKTQRADEPDAETKKRNSGKTGPITFMGRAIAALNSTKHGILSKTLILPNESLDDYTALLARWRTEFDNPGPTDLLGDFVLKTVQAEWYRLRAQRHYDFFVSLNGSDPVFMWAIEQQKQHDLMLRYLTTAERKFSAQYNQLKAHYNFQLARVKEMERLQKEQDEQAQKEQDAAPPVCPGLSVKNNDTGEVMNPDGSITPGPPGYVPEKIIPGVFGPNHPSNLPPPKGLKR